MLVVLSMLATACSGGAPEATTTAADGNATTTSATGVSTAGGSVVCAEPVTIGVVTDLTGGLSIYGTELERGVVAGLAYVSGEEAQEGDDQTYQVDDCRVRVIFADDQSNPEVAGVVARRLIEDEGVDVLVGSAGPGTTAPLAAVAAQVGVVLIATSDTTGGLSESDFGVNTFLLALSAAQHAYATCGYLAAAVGAHTFVQIAPDYPAGRRAASAFHAACELAGGGFVADDEMLSAATNDFAPVVATLAAASPDSVLLTWPGGGLGSLITEAAAAFPGDTAFGVTFPPDVIMPIYFDGAIGWTSPITYHYTSPQTDANDFLVQTESVSGSIPDQFDALGMNATLLVVAALRKTGGVTDTDVLRAAIEDAEFAGPKGTVAIRAADHLAIQDTYIVTLVSTDDPERRYYDTVATIRPEPPCLLDGDAATRCGG